MTVRVGFGQDSHRFSGDPNTSLVIGGVRVPDERGFEAASDGDVVLHALCNALLQSVGGDSLSVYADDMCTQGITDSMEYVKEAYRRVKEKGYRVQNVGISIEGKRPKILPIAPAMREAIAPVLELSPDDIGITATSGEEMTPFGKGEGVQAFAIVSVVSV
jgi:2-C-methyl-D-erythritol 2,4-cyclodiphosphate synthase